MIRLFRIIGLFIITPIMSGANIANTAEITPKQQSLNYAQELLISFKNDSAQIVLSNLIAQLTAEGELFSPLGFKVQYRFAEALEKDHQDEVAIKKLLALADQAAESEHWEVLCNTHLSLARLYEKIGLWQDCRKNLDAARSTILANALDTLQVRYSIRNSSYHRLNGNSEKAIFFARQVLELAPRYELLLDEAVGHMLMGLLTMRDSFEVAVNHFVLGGNTFRDTSDYTGYSFMLSNLTRVHFQNGKYKKALAYNDSTLLAAKKSMAMGHEQNHALSTAFILRGKIYNALGKSDSAWHYINKGHALEIEDIKASSLEKVAEIDALYHDEKKAQKIKAQEQLLAAEKERRNRTWTFFGMILIFSAILSYYYIRLRKANRKTVIQADQIAKTNQELSVSLEQQIMLQGEVHHRVKNNLQVIISLLELQKEDIKDPMAIKSLETMANRIYSMSAIHEILYLKKGSELVNLLDYTNNLCEHFSKFTASKSKPIFNLKIDNKFFNLETLMPLGIILNELLTNSLKYAQNIKNQLDIGIELLSTKDGFCLQYRDNGPGFPTGNLVQREGGLGTYLLKSMSRQLSGRLETKNDQGAVSLIYFKEKNRKEDYG